MIWIAIALFIFALFVDKKRAMEFNLAGNWALVILPLLGVLSFMLMVIFNLSLAKLIQVYLTVLLYLISGAILYRKYKLDEVKFTNQQAAYLLLGLLSFVILLIVFGESINFVSLTSFDIFPLLLIDRTKYLPLPAVGIVSPNL